MNIGYEKAEDSIRLEGWRDNWIRTFRHDEIPDFQPQEKAMIDSFVKMGEYAKLAIYLTEEKFGYNLDDDMAEFVIRELIRGDL